MGSEKVGIRKVLLGRVWAKMNLSEKMGVGKEHLSRNKGFGAKLSSLEKVGVRKGLLARKEGFLSHNRAVLREMGSEEVGMRKVLLGEIWVKMALLEKKDVGKEHMSRNKGFGAKLGFLGKESVRRD